ncbi:hypothetical protein ACX818_001411 [Acinetobacter baumannii]
MNLSEIRKQFFAEFEKETVKVECSDGKYRPRLDSKLKQIKRVPTHVINASFDSIEIKEFKQEKVQKRLNAMVRLLKSFGGVVKTESPNHVIVEFYKPNTFDVKYVATIMKEEYQMSHLFGERYKGTFFDVIIEKY